MNELLNRYNEIAGAHAYYIGFARHSVVYAVKTDFGTVCRHVRESRTSSKRGACKQVKIYISSADQQRYIMNGQAVAIGTEDELAGNKYNKGDNFERLVCKWFGLGWEKNSTPWYMGGDLEVNGEQVQVKFQGAELTNENTLARAEGR